MTDGSGGSMVSLNVTNKGSGGGTSSMSVPMTAAEMVLLSSCHIPLLLRNCLYTSLIATFGIVVLLDMLPKYGLPDLSPIFC